MNRNLVPAFVLEGLKVFVSFTIGIILHGVVFLSFLSWIVYIYSLYSLIRLVTKQTRVQVGYRKGLLDLQSIVGIITIILGVIFTKRLIVVGCLIIVHGVLDWFKCNYFLNTFSDIVSSCQRVISVGVVENEMTEQVVRYFIDDIKNKTKFKNSQVWYVRLTLKQIENFDLLYNKIIFKQ